MPMLRLVGSEQSCQRREEPPGGKPKDDGQAQHDRSISSCHAERGVRQVYGGKCEQCLAEDSGYHIAKHP